MITRTILPTLISHLEAPEITVLLGSRQVGKTTLMQVMQEHVTKHMDPRKAVVLSYNLDLSRDRDMFEQQQRVIDTIDLARGDRKAYVFIDEVQRIPDTGRFLKGIYDQAQSRYKLIISGSSALEINQQISEALTGRKRVFRIRPLSFMELLAARHSESSDLAGFARLRRPELSACFEEYLLFGGYPRVVTAASRDEKILILQEIYESYLQKDIINLLQIDKLAPYTKLTTLLAGQIGNLVNVSELSSTLRLSSPTTAKYLQFLEQTFVISLVRPYATNDRTEISKMPKVYFHDLGLRNFALQRFGPLELREDRGAVFENYVFLVLDEILHLPRKINYWRTKSGAEVDFIISTGGVDPIAIEVKAQAAHRIKKSKSLESFIQKYEPGRSYLIALDDAIGTDPQADLLPFWLIPAVAQ